MYRAPRVLRLLTPSFPTRLLSVLAMQLRSPEAILGRGLSIYQAVTFGGMALGAWLLGIVADLWSLPAAIAAAAVWLVASSLLLRSLAPMPRRDEGRVLP